MREREHITLGPRQAEIFELLISEASEGRNITTPQIAAELGIKPATVKALLRVIYRKFGVAGRHELIYGLFVKGAA